MKMKILLATLLFLLFFSSYAQDTSLTKKNLTRIFTENANGTLFNWDKSKWDDDTNEGHKSLYSEWLTSNLNDAYYLSDTVVFYNYNYAYFDLKGGLTKEWHFVKKDEIQMINGKYNSEPPIGSLEVAKYKLKIKEDEKDLYLLIYKNGVLTENFRVINLRIEDINNNREKQMYVMTLKRIRQMNN